MLKCRIGISKCADHSHTHSDTCKKTERQPGKHTQDRLFYKNAVLKIPSYYVIPSLCWKQTLASRMRIKGKPLCSHVTTDFSSDRAGAGVDCSSWASSLEPCLSELAAVVACWSRDDVLCCRGWWWKWWWWCWGGRVRNGPPSVLWLPASSLEDAVIWIKTSGGEPRNKPAACRWADETELDGTPTRPENICWGEADDSGFRQSNTPPSSRLLSDPRVWLRFLSWNK